MRESTATVIVAVVTALGSVITALIGWLARKGVNFMDQKTKVLDEASDLQRKESIKNKIVDTVTLVARATMQTYVDEVKTRNADGKLTKEEAAEAFQRTMEQSLDLLKREGIEVGQDVLGVVVEAVVGKLKVEKRAEGRGAGGVASLVPELVDKPGTLLGLDRKQRVLVTESKPEASLAFELLETRTDNWLTSGSSLDAVTTPTRGGLGVAKDIYKGAGLEVDLGAYITQDYSDLFRGRFAPAFGVGLSVSF